MRSAEDIRNAFIHRVWLKLSFVMASSTETFAPSPAMSYGQDNVTRKSFLVPVEPTVPMRRPSFRKRQFPTIFFSEACDADHAKKHLECDTFEVALERDTFAKKEPEWTDQVSLNKASFNEISMGSTKKLFKRETKNPWCLSFSKPALTNEGTKPMPEP